MNDTHPTPNSSVPPVAADTNADVELKSKTLALCRFASLLDTHRYYGSVHATSKECLVLHESVLPMLFGHADSDSICCQIPSFDLQRPSLPSVPAKAIGTSQFASPIQFAKDKLPNLPLALLEECSNLFKAIWQGRLRLAKKTMDSSFLTILQDVPTTPAAVATSVKSLSFSQRCHSEPVDLANQIDKIIVPVILSIVMDWKLPDEQTITIKVQAPGVIEGTILPNSSLHFANIELDKTALVKTMASKVKDLLQSCLIGVYRMRTSNEWIQRQTNVQASVKEEELSYVDSRGLTPLQQLFETSERTQDAKDEKNTKRTRSDSNPRIIPQASHGRRCSFDRLNMLSRAASDCLQNKPMQTPSTRLKRQKTSLTVFGDNRNAEFDVPMMRPAVSIFRVGV